MRRSESEDALRYLRDRIERALSNALIVVHANHPLSRAYDQATRALDRGDGLYEAYRRLFHAARAAGIDPGQFVYGVGLAAGGVDHPPRLGNPAGALPGFPTGGYGPRGGSGFRNQLVARWESRGRKYWVELYQLPHGNWSWASDNGGGVLGPMQFHQAMEHAKQQADYSPSTMVRVFPLPGQRPPWRDQNPGSAAGGSTDAEWDAVLRMSPAQARRYLSE